MKPVFTAEDFEPKTLTADGMELCSYTWAARMANEKLEKLIQSWPVVYGNQIEDCYNGSSSVRPMYQFTHQARLAFVEALPKAECKHEPDLAAYQVITHGNYITATPINAYCKHCRIALKAKWEEVK